MAAARARASRSMPGEVSTPMNALQRSAMAAVVSPGATTDVEDAESRFQLEVAEHFVEETFWGLAVETMGFGANAEPVGILVLGRRYADPAGVTGEVPETGGVGEVAVARSKTSRALRCATSLPESTC
jgi:hypothetical protein